MSSRPVGLAPAGSGSRVRIDRALAFACAGILAAINALSNDILGSVATNGALGALGELAGVSAVIWFALGAVLSIGLESEEQPLGTRDALVLITTGVAAFLPIVVAARLGLFGAALYLLLTSLRGTRERRVAMVLLALTGPLLWGRIVLNLFVTPLLVLDAHIVGFVMNMPAQGNVLHFANSSREFLIGGPCSSVHNISLAILLWATAASLFRLRPDARLVLFGVATVAVMFVLNIVRLTSIGLMPDHFHFLHDGTGAALFGWAGLLAAGLIVGVGVIDAHGRQR